MCPGGYVLSSATEDRRIVVNGMSNYKRNSPFANSAVVVSINHKENFGEDLWGGMKLRQELEERAYELAKSQGKSAIPVQKLSDFIEGRSGKALPSSSPSAVVPSELHSMIPQKMHQRLVEGFQDFQSKMPDFVSEQGQLHGIESRTSCPLRVTRDRDSLQSLSHQGLYPCGEGAGYAGGITSAACDGIRIAEKITEEVLGKKIQLQN